MTRTTTIITVLAILVFCSSARSDDLHVPADYNTIQAAIDDANDGDEVVLEPGTYTGDGNRDIYFLGKAIVVRSADPNDPNVVETTIIDSEGTNSTPRRGFNFSSGEGANSVLAGLTITGGRIRLGGGVFCRNSSPTIKNCVIRSNSNYYYGPGYMGGGGIYCEGSDVNVYNCTIKNNSTSGVQTWGGGVHCRGGSPKISYCVIQDNATGGGNAWGGGLYFSGGEPVVSHCLVANNSASGRGGGIYCSLSNLMISHCRITGNTVVYHSYSRGGGIFSYGGKPIIKNCIISGNLSRQGGGVFCWRDSEATLASCTFAGNSADEGKGIACSSDDYRYNCSLKGANCILWDGGGEIWKKFGVSSVSMNYSDVQGGWSGSGNVSADPCFVDLGYWDSNGLWVDGDYHLSESSPCINAGNPGYVPRPSEMDIDGQPRVIGGRVDMGAYEFNHLPVGCIVGGDRFVEAGVGCEGRVVLDGSCSSDEDSTAGTNDDINDFDWYEVIDACDANSDIFLGSGEVIECNLGLGEHLIILEVTDKAGAFDSNEVVIRVEDVTPPEFSLWVEPNVLWPPNNKMVLVTPGWEVSDNCDEQPEVSLVDITMSAEGDVNDYVQIGDEGSIYLRARKGRGGAVRIYTLTYEAVDDSGNVAIDSATVAVRHDRR